MNSDLLMQSSCWYHSVTLSSVSGLIHSANLTLPFGSEIAAHLLLRRNPGTALEMPPFPRSATPKISKIRNRNPYCDSALRSPESLETTGVAGRCESSRGRTATPTLSPACFSTPANQRNLCKLRPLLRNTISLRWSQLDISCMMNIHRIAPAGGKQSDPKPHKS